MQIRKNILWLPFVQGMYFLITAVWPLIDMTSFMAVTGPKVDQWLVRTVSMLLIPYTYICFWVAFHSEAVSKLLITVMTLTGLGLALVELIHYMNGTIKWVYAADAILQIIFVIWWLSRINHRKNEFQN